jgi:hypothetical protein
MPITHDLISQAWRNNFWSSVIKKAPHRPSSPSLAPLDFWLFGHVKHLLTGRKFPDGEALVEAVNAILADIEKVTNGEHIDRPIALLEDNTNFSMKKSRTQQRQLFSTCIV